MLKYQSIFSLCIALGLSSVLFFEAQASNDKDIYSYHNNQYSWLENSHRKAKQPKYYCAFGVSVPTYIDITKRYKGDTHFGIALSKPKKKPFYSAAAGMRSSFDDQVAFEVEALLYKSKSKVYGYTADFVHLSSDLESLSLLFNSYYMFEDYGGFYPFVGAGVGVSYNNMANIVLTPQSIAGPPREFEDKSKVSPAVQVMLGVNKNIAKHMDVQVKVKAMSLGKFVGAGSEGKFKSVALSGDIGFKYCLDHLKKIKRKSRGST